MQIANDTTPPIRELSCAELVLRTTCWIADRIQERGRFFTPDQREERARYYEERAATYVELANVNSNMLEFAGLNTLAAKILRAQG